MCGIAGLILSQGSPPPDPTTLATMIGSLAHRGPDGSGHTVVGRIALLHNRLAIIDLDGGDQPLFAGQASLVANGEIYNYRELREGLAGATSRPTATASRRCISGSRREADTPAICAACSRSRSTTAPAGA